ncbi:hypothetical protein FRC0190_02049 [Corynebacterium rouxii]|uniref:DUF6779 domain-containing protein n=2 Tax=Corynebacterium rouxii TaxID=2719119 RepID=A0A6I8MIT2_9CORY|nr:hypothetical protein FRC0190_02049 [Corynebacterium rouxii]
MEKDNGQKLLIALVVLSLIASVVMLITGNVGALKIALLASLWAAVIGFFLVSRYRTQAELARAELEIEREHHKSEIDAARETEQQLRQRDEETLEKIKEQLNEVRTQLESLTGQVFTEPAMLRAQARRIHEIEAATPDVAPSVSENIAEVVSRFTPTTAEKTPEPARSPRVDETAEFKIPAPEAPRPKAGKRDKPKPAPEKKQTKKQELHIPGAKFQDYLDKPAPKPTIAEPQGAYFDQKSFRDAVAEKETLAKKSDNKARPFDTGQFAKVDWLQGRGSEEKKNEPHGRRRRDEHNNSVSVADLLKRNQK